MIGHPKSYGHVIFSISLLYYTVYTKRNILFFFLQIVLGGKDSKDIAPVKSKASLTPPSKKFKATDHDVEKLTSPKKISCSYGWC